ncbi:MAG: hypothetical protein WBF53_03505 [Litorimonas sp.]
MTKTLLSGVAALAFALSATAAYAQDSDYSDPPVDHNEAVMDAAEDTLEAAEDTMEAAEAMEDEAPKVTYDEFGNPVEIEADVDTTYDSDLYGVETDGTATDPVTCPEGTEVQTDGSCMVVGEWTEDDQPEE